MAAVGHTGLIAPEMVKPGAAVIDVGINSTEAGLVGDVAPGVAEVAGHLTPVPGGVGPMTIACLLENAVRVRAAPAVVNGQFTSPSGGGMVLPLRARRPDGRGPHSKE